MAGELRPLRSDEYVGFQTNIYIYMISCDIMCVSIYPFILSKYKTILFTCISVYLYICIYLYIYVLIK